MSGIGFPMMRAVARQPVMGVSRRVDGGKPGRLPDQLLRRMGSHEKNVGGKEEQQGEETGKDGNVIRSSLHTTELQ